MKRVAVLLLGVIAVLSLGVMAGYSAGLHALDALRGRR